MNRVPWSGIFLCRRIRLRPVRFAASVLLLWAAESGVANGQQSAPQLDPRQAERNFDAFVAERKRPQDSGARLPQPAKPELSQDRTPLFTLKAVAVDGAHSVPAESIASIYRPYVGATVSMADLTKIAAEIGEIYRSAGYYLSRAIIPPQDIKGGRIRIRIIEGRISDIALQGHQADLFGVRGLFNAVASESPARMHTLERALLLVDGRPGVRVVDTSLEEIGDLSGNFRLIVSLETWDVYSAVGLDNRGTSQVGPMQAYWTSALNTLFIPGDVVALQVSTMPNDPRELVFGRLSYDLPIDADGARLGGSASRSEVRPSGPRRSLDTRITNDSYELRGSIVPLRTRTASLWVTASAGYSNVTEQNSLGIRYNDRIRVAGLAADLETNDQQGGWNYLTLAVRQGIPALGASSKNDGFVSRVGAPADFTKLELQYTRYQQLSDIWSLKLSITGQLASAPLLVSQMFYFGGGAFGRGYDTSAFAADNGVAGSLELRFDQKLDHELLKGYQLYGFMDKGAIWNFGGDYRRAVSPSSGGGGVRLYLPHEMQAAVEVAVPLAYRLPGSERGTPRVFFSLAKALKLCPGSAKLRCS